MEYRRLGRSGLKVSEIGLGTSSNTFVGKADEPTSIRIINAALDLGITLIDTGASYANGRSEELIGKALKEKRRQVVIATKFGNPSHLGPSEPAGGSRNHIMKAVEGSLRRLQTDYIDLYYLHFPDPETPIEETLRALDDLVRSGKVRYIGCSNFAAWQLCEAVFTSRLNYLVSFICIEPKYNALERGIEKELVPFCQAYGVGVVPWAPMAGGFLTGKYRRGEKIPPTARLAKPSNSYNYLTEGNFDKLEGLEDFAKQHGRSVGEVNIAWLLGHPWLSSVIAGASGVEQLPLNTAAVGWKLTAEDMAQIDKILSTPHG